MIWYIDPELRRTLLLEIAFQRAERSRYRAIADDEANHYGVALKARMRAEGCNRAIRALRDVWDASAAVERRHAESALASEGLLAGSWIGRHSLPWDVATMAPGELVEIWGK